MTKIFLVLSLGFYSISSFSACEKEIRAYLASELATQNYAIHDYNDGLDNYKYLGDGMYAVKFYTARTDLRRTPLVLKEWEVAVDASCRVVSSTLIDSYYY